jgi:hypothetical protein
MAKEHKEAIDIARKVCLHCREQGVEADGTCGRCGSPRTIASELRPSVAQWSRPEWTIVPEAKTNQDFYECVALSEVARDNPGPKRAVVKEISILFDYNQEHTLVYRRWLDDMDVELIPTEPKTVTSSLGRPVETRQVAIIPLQPAKKGGEPVVIGAWVVEESTWSKKKAPAIRNLRDRFISRPTISMTHTARKPAAMDLVVGRDNRKIFPKLAQEACFIGDDFVLCNIVFSPGQVIYGAAQKSIQWVNKLEDPEESKKPQFRNLGKGKKKAKGKARPAEVRIVRRVSMTNSAGQSPHHGLQDDVYGAEGGSSYRGDTPTPSDLEANFPESEIQRMVRTVGDPDFCQHRNEVELPEPGEPAAEAGNGEDVGRDREVAELPEVERPAHESVAEFLGYTIDISMQEIEERNVYYVQDELPVLRLRSRLTVGRWIPMMDTRLRGRPEDRQVRPKPQTWNGRWRST